MYPSSREIKRVISSTNKTVPKQLGLQYWGGFLDAPFFKALKHYFLSCGFDISHQDYHWTSVTDCLSNIDAFHSPDSINLISLSPFELESLSEAKFDLFITKVSHLLDGFKKSAGSVNFYIIQNSFYGSSQITSPSCLRSSRFQALLQRVRSSHDFTSNFVIDLTGSPFNTNFNYHDWCLYGFPFALSAQGYVARTIASTVISRLGSGPKLLCIDLDETLWPAIIGDLEHPQPYNLDPGNPVDRIYIDFQRFIKHISQAGLPILAISKNDPSVRPYVLTGAGHILRPSDFVSIELSWKDKHQVLRQVSSSLNIHEESIVFLDNSPAEIADLQAFSPSCQCLCVGDDPSLFIEKCLSFFPLCSLFRHADYSSRLNMFRHMLGTSHLDSQPLHSPATSRVEVTLRLASTDSDLLRAIQLLNKTNQFNLTGQKYLPHDFNDTHQVLLGEFTYDGLEYGITSVLLLETLPHQAILHQWVVSCRTFTKGYEEKLLTRLCSIFAPSVSFLSVPYRDTGRNKYMLSLFSDPTFLNALHETSVPIRFEIC